MEIPLTGLSTLTGAVVMIIAWLFVGARLRVVQSTVSRPIMYMHKFFFMMACFFLLMFLPHVLLYTNPAEFSLMMAWGYSLGHIFLYLAYIFLSLMTISILPQLAGRERLVIVVGIVANVIVTLINILTMVYGTQPVYNYAKHITQFNASPVVGISIAVLSIFSFLPPAILFLVNAWRNSGSGRLRSLLLGSGLVMMMVAGPLHDVAQNWQSFLVADIFTILSIILIGGGVAYRINVSLALQQAPSANLSAV